MTEPLNEPPHESAPGPLPDPVAAARQRHLVIGLFRLSGVFILMFGFLIMMQRFGWVQGQRAKLMGAIIATVGFIQTIVVPRILLRAWRTPPL